MSKLLTQITYGWYAECKGEAKQVAKQTMAFNTQLQSIFNTQFAGQQQALSQLSSTLNNMITNPQGYSPAGLAAMQTQAIQGNAAQFAGAQQQLNSQLSALTGGGAIGSGAAAMLQGQLDTSEAANQSNALLGIQAQNAQLQVQNRNQALGMLPGVISQQGQLPGSAGAVLQSQNNAFSQAQAAFKSPWTSILGGIAGTALSAFTGGLGGALGSSIFGGGQQSVSPLGNAQSLMSGYTPESMFANPITPGTAALGGFVANPYTGGNPVPTGGAFSGLSMQSPMLNPNIASQLGGFGSAGH